MSQYLADTLLSDLLPSSIKDDPSLAAAALASQPELSAVVAETPRALVYHNLEALPDAVLDLVAWGWHVDGYDLLETRAERLHVLRNFFDYHRFKGTKYGLALYFATFLKRALLAASPPSKSHIGASLSEAERAAFEAPHPEVRVYPFRHAGTRAGAYLGDFAGACFPARGDALLRIGDRVTFFDPLTGKDTALDALETTRDILERQAVSRVPVRIPGSAGKGVFAGAFLVGFTADTDAASRCYELEQSVPYTEELERRRALSVRPSLEPIAVGYDWVGEPGARQALHLGNRWPDVYPQTGGGFIAGCFVGSTARDRIYRRTKLFDPARVVLSRRNSSTFLGAFKLGALRPHTAEAAVDMARTAPAGAAFGCGYLGSRKFFVDQASGEWLSRMCRVGRMAARYSDKISVSVTNRWPVTASAAVLAGSVVAGEYKLEVF